MAELNLGPPYVCKLVKPFDEKNRVEPKNNKFVAKTHTFNVTKCDVIFDLLVADGQIIVPRGQKTPPFEQRKKRRFCKFHNFLGHKTSHCIIFRDLVQEALNEEKLKFAGKAKTLMQVDFDPLQIKDTNNVKPLKCLMLKATESPGVAMEVSDSEYDEKVKVIYLNVEEELVDFLNRYKLKGSEVMLCPRCNIMFDRKAT